MSLCRDCRTSLRSESEEITGQCYNCFIISEEYYFVEMERAAVLADLAGVRMYRGWFKDPNEPLLTYSEVVARRYG